MKSPSHIRAQRRALERRLLQAPGVRERAALEAMIGTLKWVADSRHPHNPESYWLDAMAEDQQEAHPEA